MHVCTPNCTHVSRLIQNGYGKCWIIIKYRYVYHYELHAVAALVAMRGDRGVPSNGESAAKQNAEQRTRVLKKDRHASSVKDRHAQPLE